MQKYNVFLVVSKGRIKITQYTGNSYLENNLRSSSQGIEHTTLQLLAANEPQLCKSVKKLFPGWQ